MGLEQKIYDLALYFTDEIDESSRIYYRKLFDIPVKKLNVSQIKKIQTGWYLATIRHLLKMQIPLRERVIFRDMEKSGSVIFKKQRKLIWAIIYQTFREKRYPLETQEWFIRNLGKSLYVDKKSKAKFQPLRSTALNRKAV